MKKLISIVFVFIFAAVLTTSCTSMHNQDGSSGCATACDASGKKFQECKAKALNRIDQRLAKLQQLKSCVQAADTQQALRACKQRKSNYHQG